MDYEEHLLSVKSRRPVFLMFFHFLINHEQMKKKSHLFTKGCEFPPVLQAGELGRLFKGERHLYSGCSAQ